MTDDYRPYFAKIESTNLSSEHYIFLLNNGQTFRPLTASVTLGHLIVYSLLKHLTCSQGPHLVPKSILQSHWMPFCWPCLASP